MLRCFLLVTLFASLTTAGRCSNMQRDGLLPCFHLMDANHDGNITKNEIPLSFSKPWFFEMCDLNSDGVLNMADWFPDNACCRTQECIYKVCNLCFNKYTMP